MRASVKLITMCFLALSFTGCASDAVVVHHTDEKVQDAKVLVDLQELGLPLVGDNVFDPKSVQIGEKVQGFVLTEIDFWEATQDYPLDTVSAKFTGEAVLEGELTFIKNDGEFYYRDWLIFKPDAQSQKKLPISHHEPGHSTITFSNQDEAVSVVGITPGESRMVTLKIQDYALNFLPTDAENVAKFLDFYPE